MQNVVVVGQIERLPQRILTQIVACQPRIDEIPRKIEIQRIEEGIADAPFDAIDGIGRIAIQTRPSLPFENLFVAFVNAAVVINDAQAPMRGNATGPERADNRIGFAVERFYRHGVFSDRVGVDGFGAVKRKKRIRSPIRAQAVRRRAHDEIVENVEGARDADSLGNVNRRRITESQVPAQQRIAVFRIDIVLRRIAALFRVERRGHGRRAARIQIVVSESRQPRPEIPVMFEMGHALGCLLRGGNNARADGL